MKYKPDASHHSPNLLLPTDNDAAVEYINDDFLFLSLVEKANGHMTGMNTCTDMPAPVEYNGIVEAQVTDECCVENAKRLARKCRKVFF